MLPENCSEVLPDVAASKNYHRVRVCFDKSHRLFVGTAGIGGVWRCDDSCNSHVSPNPRCICLRIECGEAERPSLTQRIRLPRLER